MEREGGGIKETKIGGGEKLRTGEKKEKTNAGDVQSVGKKQQTNEKAKKVREKAEQPERESDNSRHSCAED
jgi:hypothetical protein